MKILIWNFLIGFFVSVFVLDFLVFILESYYESNKNDDLEYKLAETENPIPIEKRIKSTPLIFVLGKGGSGTTLMRTILDASPRINCGHETKITPRSLEFLYEYKSKHIRKSQYSLHESTIDEAMSLLLFKVYENNKNSPSVDILCAKDPASTEYIDYLHKLFPQAKFVYMIRDGRGSAMSEIKRTHSKLSTSHFYKKLAEWNKKNTKGFTDCNELGSKFCKFVKYEQLVLESEKTIREIIKFLEIDFDPLFLKFYESTDTSFKDEATHSEIYTDRLNSWRGHVAYDKKYVKITFPMIEKFGYKIDFNDPIDGTISDNKDTNN